MADISMCLNHACPSAKSCYRHEAKPNEWRQAYMQFEPDASGKCHDFTPVSGVNHLPGSALNGGNSDGN